MPVLAKYLRDSGAIVGCWQGSSLAMLDQQRKAHDATYGYHLVREALDPGLLQERWYVQGGALHPKTQVMLQANPTPFPADAVTVCRVTVSPFVPCTLLINGQALALIPEDDTVELTSDGPMTFQIVLQPMVTHWAEPISLEAV